MTHAQHSRALEAANAEFDMSWNIEQTCAAYLQALLDSPEMVEVVARSILAYYESALCPDSPLTDGWQEWKPEALAALAAIRGLI